MLASKISFKLPHFIAYIKDVSINEVQRGAAIDSRFDDVDDDEELETPPPKPTKKSTGRRNKPRVNVSYN